MNYMVERSELNKILALILSSLLVLSFDIGIYDQDNISEEEIALLPTIGIYHIRNYVSSQVICKR